MKRDAGRRFRIFPSVFDNLHSSICENDFGARSPWSVQDFKTIDNRCFRPWTVLRACDLQKCDFVSHPWIILDIFVPVALAGMALLGH